MTEKRSEQPMITVPDLCPLHLRLFVHGAGLGPHEAWRSFVVGAQVALFQATTVDPQAHQKMGGDITKLPMLGCLGCFKPDAFGEVVEVAKSKDLGAVKALGDRWIAQAAVVE